MSYDPDYDPGNFSPRYNFRAMSKQPPPTHPVRSGYHGTTRGLQGDELRPDIGREQPRHGISSRAHVNWFTSPTGENPQAAERTAWDWASPSAPPTQAELSRDPSAGRPRVHETYASGRVGADPNLEESNRGIMAQSVPTPMAASSAQVTNTRWTPPPSEEAQAAGRGVQGTIPEINWNQFGAPNTGNPEDTDGAHTMDDMGHSRARKRAAQEPPVLPSIKGRVELPGQGNLFA